MLTPPADIVARAKATIRECSVTDVNGCINGDTLVIDIREPGEFERGHLPGAVLLPRGLLEFEIHNLVARYCEGQPGSAEDYPIVLYCGTGGRSALAAETMSTMGYRNARSMAGGIVAWSQAGLPVRQPA